MNERFQAYDGGLPYMFVSYKHTDAHLVYPIIDQLNKEGYRIWYDQGIPPTEEWRKVINQHIEDCSLFVVFVTKFSMKSSEVVGECTYAINLHKTMHIIYLEDVPMSRVDGNLRLTFTNAQSVLAYQLPPNELEQKIKGPMRAFNSSNIVSTGAYIWRSIVNKICEKSDINKNHNNFSLIALMIALLAIVGLVAYIFFNPAGFDNIDEPEPTDSSTTTTTTTTTASTTTTTKATTTTTAPSVFPQLENLSVGDRFFFGSYEQDNDLSNGAEPIEWRVLDIRDDDSALVISEYGLDCVPYNETFVHATWETCTLRSWLNSDFMSDAFSTAEQQKIRDTTLSNPDNPYYEIDGGNVTSDKLFCLDFNMAIVFFSGRSIRKCAATDYAVENGACTENGNCWWWLSSPGMSSRHVMGVDSNGSIYADGSGVDGNEMCVRPAFYIDLNQ